MNIGYYRLKTYLEELWLYLKREHQKQKETLAKQIGNEKVTKQRKNRYL